MSDTRILFIILAVVFCIPLALLVTYFLARAVSYGWHMGKFSAIFQKRLHNRSHEEVSDES